MHTPCTHTFCTQTVCAPHSITHSYTLHAPHTHPPCKRCMHHAHTPHANTACTTHTPPTPTSHALHAHFAQPTRCKLHAPPHTARTTNARCSLPTSNSVPLSWKVWQQPPAWSCCSNTSTRLPTLARMHAAARPPMPLPMTTASKSCGTRAVLNPVHGEGSTVLRACTPAAGGVHPASMQRAPAERATRSSAACTCPDCDMHPHRVQHAAMKCAVCIRAVCAGTAHPRSVHCAAPLHAVCSHAACTGAARGAHPCSVQHGPTQHTKCTHLACNTHLCSVHWPSTPCNPTQRAIHTRAARSSQALCTRVQRVPRSHATTHCTCREHSRHPALHGPAGRDGHTDIQPHTHTAPNSPLLSTLSRTRGSVTNGRGGPGGGRAKGFPAEPSRRCASSPSSSAARHGGSSSSSSAAHMAAAGRHRRSAAARRGWGGVDAEHLAAPPGTSERGLRGAEQLIAAAAAYRHGGLRPAGSQPAVCTPRGCVPLLSAPPATPPRCAAGPQSGVHGWCVCVSVVRV